MMINFNNFKIKRGPSETLHSTRLIIEEGCWYLSTDTAELYVGIIENGFPVLKPINGELIPNLTGYATEDFVQEAIKNINIPEVNLTNYYTKEETYSKEEVDALLPHEEIEEVKTTVQTIVPTVQKVEEILPKVEDKVLPAVETVAELRTWVENKDYLQDIDLKDYAKLTDLQIGESFITDITLGHLEAGTEIKASMTLGEILKRILCNPEHSCNHEWLDATCTTPKICKLCGKTDGKALGHNYTEMSRVEPDCTTNGSINYACERCGHSYVETIPAKGHTESVAVEENRIEATCEKEGSYDSVIYCSECEAELSRIKKTISKLPHEEEIIPGREATCTESGLTEGKKCKVCGTITVPQVEIPAKGHTPGESVVENNVDPTCETDGSYDSVKYCIICSSEISRDPVIVPALGHVELTRDENRVEPTTEQDGSYDVVTYCDRCGKILNRKTIVLPKIEPEVPGGIIDEIISKDLSMYSVTNEGELVTIPFEIMTFNSRVDANQAPINSGFYQVKDENGKIIESGYQDLQIVNDEMYYVIALPKSVDYNSNTVRLQAYDDEEKLWLDCTKLALVSDVTTVNALCDEAGIDISHINTDIYTIWALEDTCTGSKLRYIIIE